MHAPQSSTPKPAGTKSYTCRVARGRGSYAPTFDAWGDTEAEAIENCLNKAATGKARVSDVYVSEFTADGNGFCYSSLIHGGRRYSIKEARSIAAGPLPYPLDFKGALQFVEGWLAEAEYKRQPDHDGDNGKGFRLFTDGWGHVIGHHYAIVGVQPAWAMYGK